MKKLVSTLIIFCALCCLKAQSNPKIVSDGHFAWTQCEKRYSHKDVDALSIYFLRSSLSDSSAGSFLRAVNSDVLKASNDAVGYSVVKEKSYYTIKYSEVIEFDAKQAIVARVSSLDLGNNNYLCRCIIYVDGSMGQYFNYFIVSENENEIYYNGKFNKNKIITKVAMLDFNFTVDEVERICKSLGNRKANEQ